jgi:hypothetical protein
MLIVIVGILSGLGGLGGLGGFGLLLLGDFVLLFVLLFDLLLLVDLVVVDLELDVSYIFFLGVFASTNC